LLIGSGGFDFIDGGEGDDRYYVFGGGEDVLADSGGTDAIYTWDSDFTLAAGFENLVFINNAGAPHSGRGNDGGNTISGADGNDSIAGLGGDDVLYGRFGDDTFDMSPGADGSWGSDIVDGGIGTDTLDFSHAPAAIQIDLAAGTLSGGNGTLSFTNIENVIGSAFADDIRGRTNTGNVLDGGAGQDVVTGGDWTDTFAFTATPGAANADFIVGFATGGFSRDALRFDGSTYTRIGTSDFASGDARFYAAPGATSGQDSTDRLIYDTSSGNLYYDEDGNGSGTSLLVATLQGAPALDGAQIHVVNGQPDTSGDVNRTGTSGNDSLVGGDGNDTLSGLAGDDTLVGFDGNDSLDGGDGNNQLDGGRGSDTLNGGTGNDTYITDFGDSIVDAGGTDTVIYSGSGGSLSAGLENLTLRGQITSVDASANGNELDNVVRIEFTSNTAVWVNGGAGNDTLIGGDSTSERFQYSSGSGQDSVNGGGGFDFLFLSDPATVNFRTGMASLNFTLSRVTFTNVEAVVGSGSGDWLEADDAGRRFMGQGGDDTFVGGAGNDEFSGDTLWDVPSEPLGHDSMIGGGGNDSLSGDRGFDTLDGGTGNDVLRGGSDNDVFRFTVAPGTANADTIADFQPGADRIQLDAAVMTALGASGAFAAGDARFWTGAAAHDGDDRVVYDSANGQLWYDADGSASGGAQLIATLTGAPSLAATDITVISPAGPGTTINGTAGDDSLAGGSGNDTLNGLGGNDTLDGRGGADSMTGGAGDDLYFVDDGADTVVELENGGIDEVRSSATSFTLPDWLNNLTLLTGAADGVGNALENILIGNGSANRLSGGDGSDTLNGGGGGDALTGGAGADAFVFDILQGGGPSIEDFASGVDKIRLDASVFTALGASGNFAAGDARFWAGSAAHDADDRVIYDSGRLLYDADGSGAGEAQFITWVNGTVVATDIAVDHGSTPPPPSGGSTINGTTGNDTLVGTGGNDSIYGNSGNDWIEGRNGNDTVSGGSGQDSYVFREFGAANADIVTSFDSDWDMLRFDNAAFTTLGADGRFSAGDARFYAAAGASGGHDADDRLVYNTSSGQLYYDADGSGDGGAQLVATVQAAPAVGAGDIWVM
jgi:Ca2+-binding RTX toxin-like protein